MSIKHYFYAFGAFILVSLTGTTAHGLEKIIYNQSISKSSSLLIYRFLDTEDNLDIARVDLNEDGLNEFIVRDAACGNTGDFCDFDVLAEDKGKIISLGHIRARTLVLGNQYSAGVRHILAYQNPVNDYSYAVYVWEPERSRYILLE